VKSREETRCPACDTDATGLGFSRDSEATQPRLLLHITRERAGSLRRKYTIGGRSSPQMILADSQDIQQSAIDRMDAHRRLHSAECGQLRPRARPNTTEMQASLEDRPVNQVSHPRATSWPTRENSVRLSQKLPKKPEQRTSPLAVPHRAAVESATSSKACPSAWTGRTQGLMKEKLSVNRVGQPDNLSTLPSMSSSTTLSTTSVLTEPLSFPNTQRRQVNNGFEVLPAGTLGKEPQVNTLGLWPATVADRPGAKKKRNKLQKRARSGSVSSISSSSSHTSKDRISLDFELRSAVF
jgi:hypothetical protein